MKGALFFVSILGLLFFHRQHSHDQQSDERLVCECQNLHHEKRWRYFGDGDFSPFSQLHTALKICEHKYPKDITRYQELRKRLEKELNQLKREKRNLQAWHHQQLRSVKYRVVGKTEDGLNIVESEPKLPRFHESSKVIEFKREKTKIQARWVEEELKLLPAKCKNALEKERARLLYVRFGFDIFFHPEFSSQIKLSEKERSEFHRLRSETYKKIRSEREKFFEISVKKVLEQLNSKQLKTIEKRLGVLQEQIPKFLNYKSIVRFREDMEVKRKFYQYDVRSRREFKGINGLVRLNKELPGDLIVRYHVSEYLPKRKMSDAELSQLRRYEYKTLSVPSSPINQLAISSLERYLSVNTPLATWGMEPTEEQFKKFSKAVGQWERGIKSNNTIADYIENNNLFLQELAEFFLDKQGLNFFRGIFFDKGPVAFCFMPGVARELKISEVQLQRIKETGKKNVEKAQQIQRDMVVAEMNSFSEVVGTSGVKKIEKILGMKLSNAMFQRLEFLTQKGFPSEIVFEKRDIEEKLRVKVNGGSRYGFFR